MRRRVTFPFFVNALIIAAGALAVGRNIAADVVAPSPERIVESQTITQTSTRLVTRNVKGRIIRLPGGERVVHVPLIVVHTSEKVIRVPAHNLAITRVGSAIVAQPHDEVTVQVTVGIPLLGETVTVTTTSPASTETVIVPTTITVTLPVIDPPTNPTTEGAAHAHRLLGSKQRQRARRLRQGQRHRPLPEGHRGHHLRRQHLPDPS